MARRTFEEGFKEKAVAYYYEHPELTVKARAEAMGIGYSTLRRWITEAEEQAAAGAESAMASAEESVAEPASEEAVEPAQTEAPVEASVEDETEAADEIETPADEVAEAVSVVNEPVPANEMPAQEDNDADADATAEQAAPTEPEAVAEPAAEETLDDEPFEIMCKSNPEASKFKPRHSAGSRLITITAQVGNLVEDVTTGMSAAAERVNLYKKRFDLKKQQKKLQKAKEKHQKR